MRTSVRTVQSVDTTTETRQADLADEYWTIRHLKAVLPFKRTKLYATIALPDFPLPLETAPGAGYLWVASEVRAWLESRPRVTVRRAPRQKIHNEQQGELEFVIAEPGRRRQVA